MSDAAPTHATWKTSQTFRRWLALALRAEGLSGVDFRPAHRTTPGEYETDSAITGVDNWAFAISTDTRRDLSGTLDRARRAAAQDGSSRCAAIFHRPGREPDECYVLLDFRTLVSILKTEAV